MLQVQRVRQAVEVCLESVVEECDGFNLHGGINRMRLPCAQRRHVRESREHSVLQAALPRPVHAKGRRGQRSG